MAQQGVEENKTEEATPHKLSKARERGQVARGTDVGFFSTMLASAALLLIFGTHLSTLLRNAMAQALLSIPAASGTAQTVSILVAQVSGPAIQIVLLVGVCRRFLRGCCCCFKVSRKVERADGCMFVAH